MQITGQETASQRKYSNTTGSRPTTVDLVLYLYTGIGGQKAVGACAGLSKIFGRRLRRCAGRPVELMRVCESTFR